jgi:hypothetical protein
MEMGFDFDMTSTRYSSSISSSSHRGTDSLLVAHAVASPAEAPLLSVRRSAMARSKATLTLGNCDSEYVLSQSLVVNLASEWPAGGT